MRLKLKVGKDPQGNDVVTHPYSTTTRASPAPTRWNCAPTVHQAHPTPSHMLLPFTASLLLINARDGFREGEHLAQSHTAAPQQRGWESKTSKAMGTETLDLAMQAWP